MDRRRGRILGLFCLLALQASVLAEEPVDSTAANLGGAAPAAAVRASVLDYYDTSDALPDFPMGGDFSGYGLPDRGYYPIRGRNWLQFDYLLWWVQGQNIPALAVAPGGSVVFGQERIDGDVTNGLRLRGGHFFDCDGTCGLMVDFFGLENDGGRRGAVSATPGGLSMPFTDMDLSLPSNLGPDGCACLDDLVGTPSIVPIDSISTRSSSDIWSGGAYYRGRILGDFDCCAADRGCCPTLCRYGHRLDKIIGYRYFGFDESLGISGVFAPATGTLVANDVFSTQNRFHGLDVGLIYEVDRGRWSLETLGRIAFGVNNQELTIAGSGNQGGGIFAQYTNIGAYQHDAFTVIPELNLTLAYAITPRLRGRVGYAGLLLSNVIRPAAQIDTRLDGRFFDSTQARPLADPLAFFPRPRYETESVWLHGLTFGLEYSF
jgi:hypothetical protein